MKAKLEMSHILTGALLALMLVAVVVTAFSSLMADLQTNYGLPGNNTLTKYNHTATITNATEEIKDATDVEGDQEGWTDIIGAYYRTGYQALRISGASFSLFSDIGSDAAEDAPGVSMYITIVVGMIIIILVIGLILTALLKWKV